MVGVDDASPQILCMNYFIKAQCYHINSTMVYQDNQSTILLEKNGKQISGKRTRYTNIQYLSITDCVQAGEMTAGYCLAKKMIADHFTKPLQRTLLQKFRSVIMNIDKFILDANLTGKERICPSCHRSVLPIMLP